MHPDAQSKNLDPDSDRHQNLSGWFLDNHLKNSTKITRFSGAIQLEKIDWLRLHIRHFTLAVVINNVPQYKSKYKSGIRTSSYVARGADLARQVNLYSQESIVTT